MLSLYNNYKSIILESTEIDAIQDAINKHSYVNIMYDGKSSNIRRYCQIYNIGTTSKGNVAVRVFQVFGPGKRDWKTFDINKIQRWEPTEMTFHQPVSKQDSSIKGQWNPNGDYTLGNSAKIADFTEKEKEI